MEIYRAENEIGGRMSKGISPSTMYACVQEFHQYSQRFPFDEALKEQNLVDFNLPTLPKNNDPLMIILWNPTPKSN